MPGKSRGERGKRNLERVHTIARSDQGIVYSLGETMGGHPDKDRRRLNPSLAGKLGVPSPDRWVFRPMPKKGGGYKFKRRPGITARSGDDILVHEGKITGKAKYLYLSELGYE